MNESNKQIDTFSQLRLPLIVLITFAHSYSGVRAGWTLWDGGWDTYEVLKLVVSETMVKVAMPTFFVMSGYLFFVNVTEWNAKTYWNKLRRRVKTLLIPYIIWNSAMAVKLKTFSLRKKMAKASLERSKQFDKETYAKNFFKTLEKMNTKNSH